MSDSCCSPPSDSAAITPLPSAMSAQLQQAPLPSSTSTTVLIIQHSDRVPPAYVVQFLTSNSIPFHIIHIDYPDAVLPPLTTQWKAIISLGGPQGSYEEDLHPWMKSEKALLRHYAENNTPLLGICLGCQMLADCLGGRVYPAEKMEVGYTKVELTEEGRKDQVLVKLWEMFPAATSAAESTAVAAAASSSPPPPSPPTVDRFLMHHGDTFDLPSTIPLLAASTYKQLFRFNRAMGVQFHPEASVDEIESWTSWNPQRYIPLGTTAEEIVAQVKERKEKCSEMSRVFFEAWWTSNGEGYELKTNQ